METRKTEPEIQIPEFMNRKSGRVLSKVLTDRESLETTLQSLMNDRLAEKTEKELIKANPEYAYAVRHLETIKKLLAEVTGSSEFYTAYVEALDEVYTTFNDAMYLRGLKDGFNLADFAAGGRKATVYGREY